MGSQSFNTFTNEIDHYLDNLGIAGFIGNPIKMDSLSTNPRLEKITVRDDAYYFYYLSRGKTQEFYLESEIQGHPRIQKGYPRNQSIVVINLNNPLIQIRCHQRGIANSILDQLKNWFPGTEGVEFSKKNAIYWIDLARRLSNIRFKVQRENLASISMTAQKEGDLKQEEELLQQYFDEGICSGFYITVTGELEGQERNIGILFNVKQGKLFFKSFSSESDIRFVLSKVIELLGI